MTSPDSAKISIKQWAEEDRPREKLLMKGVSALSNSELLAILIRSGNDKESAVELSRRILQKADNDLGKLAKFTVSDLINNFRGIGMAKAVAIVAAMELGKRRKESGVAERKKILSSRDALCCFFFCLYRSQSRRNVGIAVGSCQSGG